MKKKVRESRLSFLDVLNYLAVGAGVLAIIILLYGIIRTLL